MKQNNNLFALPFYTSPSEWQNNKPQAYGEVFPLVTPTWPLPDFQFSRAYNGRPIRKAYIHYLTGEEVNLTTKIQQAATIIVDGGIERIVVAFAGIIPPQPLPNGRCYLVVEDGYNTWYSEIMTMCDTSEYLTLEWRDSINVEVGDQKIIYEGTNFKNKLYLCAQIGMPDYTYTEEGEERDGRFFPVKQISDKVYKFSFVAPEYMCDALRLVPLAEYVVVTDPFGVTYECESILITPSWLEQGNLARVDVEIHVDTICKRIGKGYDSH